ncbi:MAG: 50S ribosomal protein L11 methyltransferase [Clostridia bacterium]|nr:50S ribosomal protein L11 methyltransferase [Clostridia bacterium]
MENQGGWTELKVTSDIAGFDTVCAVMSMLDSRLQIEDYSDLDELMLDGVYGDLIDENVKNADKAHASASIYVPDEKPLFEYVSYLRERFSSLGIDAKIDTVGVREEDWAENWKKYYHKMTVGNVVIVPAWEEYTPKGCEASLYIDPGMAFGTGEHETTRLVIELMQKYAPTETGVGGRMLDLGCGSGILAIAASKLGFRECFAYDVDPVAVRVAKENVERNGVTNVNVGVSDLAADVDRTEKYSLITANIVADIIIKAAPEFGGLLAEDGALIVSGIIDERLDDVLSVLSGFGLSTSEVLRDNGWCAASLKLK